MRGLMPNPLTKLSESTEEDEVLRSRKRKLDMEAESDGEQLREQLRLHLEDKRILNGDAGKRLRRDFGRLLKSGEERVPMADIDYEIYKYINELADQYIELDDLLEQNGVSYSEALEQAAQFRKQFLCLLEKHAVRNQDLVVTCWDLMERIEQQPEHPDLQYLYFCVVTDFGLLNAVNAADRTEEQKIRNYFRQQNALRELTDFFQAQSENLQKYLEKRKLQLIDCQNIFCEVDKYTRVAFPNYKGNYRSRIKQHFIPNLAQPIDYFYPPKWGIT